VYTCTTNLTRFLLYHGITARNLSTYRVLFLFIHKSNAGKEIVSNDINMDYLDDIDQDAMDACSELNHDMLSHNAPELSSDVQAFLRSITKCQKPIAQAKHTHNRIDYLFRDRQPCHSLNTRHCCDSPVKSMRSIYQQSKSGLLKHSQPCRRYLSLSTKHTKSCRPSHLTQLLDWTQRCLNTGLKALIHLTSCHPKTNILCGTSSTAR
jgi:hypothetical protein